MASVGAAAFHGNHIKHPLRAWEPQHALPRLLRERLAEAGPPDDWIDRLRAIRSRGDAGDAADLAAPTLGELVAPPPVPAAGAPSPAASPEPDLSRPIALLRARDVEGLRRFLVGQVERSGLAGFLADWCEPLSRLVDDPGERDGALEGFERQLCRESLESALGYALATVPPGALDPAVLLTTLPADGRRLELVMLEATLALEGCRCVSLGTMTPVAAIVRAAQALRADVVAVPVGTALPRAAAVDRLARLRAALPSRVVIWGEGRRAAAYCDALPGTRRMNWLREVAPAVLAWRAAHARG